jgi:nitroreductase/NAD-dependent dihydropyrimidine dehydrogenase PreA subunit
MPDLGPPTLDPQRCTGCGQCVTACASLVLGMTAPAEGAKKGKVRLEHPDWCNACGHCEALCAFEAIRSPLPLPEGAPVPGKVPAVDPEQLAMLLRERRSVRAYKPDPVPRELLERVIDVARYTPTGTNSQNVHWLVLDDRDKVRELQQRCVRFYERLFNLVNNPVGRLGVRVVAGARQRAQLEEYLPVVQEANRRMAEGDDRLLYDAPAVVLVHAEAWDSCSSFNCDTALFSASLMAHSLGLGCCFNGFVQQAVENSRPLKKWLGIPRDHRCFMAMGLGRPALRYRQLCERQPAALRWFE